MPGALLDVTFSRNAPLTTRNPRVSFCPEYELDNTSRNFFFAPGFRKYFRSVRKNRTIESSSCVRSFSLLRSFQFALCFVAVESSSSKVFNRLIALTPIASTDVSSLPGEKSATSSEFKPRVLCLTCVGVFDLSPAFIDCLFSPFGTCCDPPNSCPSPVSKSSVFSALFLAD